MNEYFYSIFSDKENSILGHFFKRKYDFKRATSGQNSNLRRNISLLQKEIYNREELLLPIGKGEIEEEGYHTYHCRKLDSFLYKIARSVTSKKNIHSTYLGGGLNLATKIAQKV